MMDITNDDIEVDLQASGDLIHAWLILLKNNNSKHSKQEKIKHWDDLKASIDIYQAQALELANSNEEDTTKVESLIEQNNKLIAECKKVIDGT